MSRCGSANRRRLVIATSLVSLRRSRTAGSSTGSEPSQMGVESHERQAVPPSPRLVARDGRRLIFLAPGDVSKGRVEPISWMRTCEAYAGHGLEVTLTTLRTRRPDSV